MWRLSCEFPVGDPDHSEDTGPDDNRGVIALPVAWGYEQRKQARTWQNVACAYRIKEVARRTPILAATEPGRDACMVLERLGLGLDLEVSRLSVVR